MNTTTAQIRTTTTRLAGLAAALLVTLSTVQVLATYGHPPVIGPVLASASRSA